MLNVTRVQIGDIALGMERKELEAHLTSWHDKLNADVKMYVGREERYASTHYAVRYLLGQERFLFMVEYNEWDKAISLSVDSGAAGLNVSYNEINVFQTEAECLVETLKQQGDCLFDGEDIQLATQYTFPSLGIRLWRENAFHRKLLENKEWVEEVQAVLEDE